MKTQQAFLCEKNETKNREIFLFVVTITNTVVEF